MTRNRPSSTFWSHRGLTGALRASILALAIVAGACSDDVTGPPAARGLQGLSDSLADAWDVPGLVVAVRHSGEEPNIVASGRADLGSGRRMTPLDRFRVGSLTKPMVAIVILQLADEGRLALDDPLARFLPSILPDGDRITLRQLLNHTSGIGDYTDDPGFLSAVLANPARVWTPQELIAIGAAMPRLFAPGAADRWDYSNTNYILLGLVAEAAGGQPIATLLRTRVFERVGMASTYYGERAIAACSVCAGLRRPERDQQSRGGDARESDNGGCRRGGGEHCR